MNFVECLLDGNGDPTPQTEPMSQPEPKSMFMNCVLNRAVTTSEIYDYVTKAFANENLNLTNNLKVDPYTLLWVLHNKLNYEIFWWLKERFEELHHVEGAIAYIYTYAHQEYKYYIESRLSTYLEDHVHSYRERLYAINEEMEKYAKLLGTKFTSLMGIENKNYDERDVIKQIILMFILECLIRKEGFNCVSGISEYVIPHFYPGKDINRFANIIRHIKDKCTNGKFDKFDSWFRSCYNK